MSVVTHVLEIGCLSLVVVHSCQHLPHAFRVATRILRKRERQVTARWMEHTAFMLLRLFTTLILVAPTLYYGLEFLLSVTQAADVA